MLSKKMAFSLMSLITIFALTFVVSSAMAEGEFEVKIVGRTAVTYVDAADDIRFTLKVTAGQLIPTLTMGSIKTQGEEEVQDKQHYCDYFR